MLSGTYGTLCFVNDYGRLLGLGQTDGGEVWRAPAREGARVRAEAGPPQVHLKSDAIVALAGGLAFSVSPLEPAAPGGG